MYKITLGPNYFPFLGLFNSNEYFLFNNSQASLLAILVKQTYLLYILMFRSH